MDVKFLYEEIYYSMPKHDYNKIKYIGRGLISGHISKDDKRSLLYLGTVIQSKILLRFNSMIEILNKMKRTKEEDEELKMCISERNMINNDIIMNGQIRMYLKHGKLFATQLYLQEVD